MFFPISMSSESHLAAMSQLEMIEWMLHKYFIQKCFINISIYNLLQLRSLTLSKFRTWSSQPKTRLSNPIMRKLFIMISIWRILHAISSTILFSRQLGFLTFIQIVLGHTVVKHGSKSKLFMIFSHLYIWSTLKEQRWWMMSEHHVQTKPNVIVRLMEVTQWQFFNIEYLGM